MNYISGNDTIAAIATPSGTGGLAVIRVSGPESRSIVTEAWKGAKLTRVKSHTAHYGKYVSTAGETLDEAVATVFLSPHSFTGEDTVEISVHGSSWIQREILNDLIRRGARMSNPGEFTQRAFMNGKMDLAQAEGVADLIASSSKASHAMALNQMKGTFSRELEVLRQSLIDFASLMELELDFSEEDVEFANRKQLIELCDNILRKVGKMADSYSKGRVLKEGVPVVIAGMPNAGKSTLLNLLLNDEKAIVTDIPGTTRDIIEDTMEINGVLYRFIDTAGIRETADEVEGIGVERAREAMGKAYIVIWVIDSLADIVPQLEELDKFKELHPQTNLIVLSNKNDSTSVSPGGRNGLKECETDTGIPFSAKTGQGMPQLISELDKLTQGELNLKDDILVTNGRHYESLVKASEALTRARQGLEEGISGDFIAQEIREATHYLATVTGEINTDTLLSTIFSRFCIGK